MTLRATRRSVPLLHDRRRTSVCRRFASSCVLKVQLRHLHKQLCPARPTIDKQVCLSVCRHLTQLGLSARRQTLTECDTEGLTASRGRDTHRFKGTSKTAVTSLNTYITHTHSHTYTHTYTRTHIHTRTHTHTHATAGNERNYTASASDGSTYVPPSEALS